ncbi:Glycosyltransferase [Rhynchospora pubera]|uniref:Glycosyltransferases n=1 Tax=Rhynchospora pubera TaxID=906938 RepID=A0AAV8G6P1_9POAL|nr:Glycosyltransferase [Rhynchospora pubera]
MLSLVSISLHTFSCLLSLYLGFRFSRLFSFSPPSEANVSFPPLPLSYSPPKPLVATITKPARPRPISGRHVISVRPWAHPDPSETLRAHRILSAVQSEQRRRHISPRLPSPPRKFLIVTPMYSRTFQAIHLSSLAHSLLILPYPVTWIVIEPHSSVNDTSAILARFSKLDVLWLTYPGSMPNSWAQRGRVESRMRLMALREIRDQQLDGIIVFADESNVHTMELFDEAQMVKWIASASVGILAHTGILGKDIEESESTNKWSSSLGFPVIGPACNSSGHYVGWHALDTSNYTGKIANFVGDEGLVVPNQFEWAGFVMDSRLVWEKAEERPDWVRAFNVGGPDVHETEIESPLDLVKDMSFVEPIGRCGNKVLLWWVRTEARFDGKFPTRWIIDKPLQITVPAKQTPWPELPPEIVIPKPTTPAQTRQSLTDKQHSKTGRSPRPRHRSRGKRRRESHMNS